VTVTAIEAHAANVMRVAKRHGLLTRLISACDVRGVRQLRYYPGHKPQNEYRSEDRNARERIRAVTKDLGHGLCASHIENR
jgi:hypothetical protein